ncbi:uncharacterized protein FPRO_15562 [Fusarium proliferatum ET1]|uniref:Carboxylic ester hydrolase n=1 Tax=Fusarium proliferatum (strain ET1) TaxID=1227346 RepID=A0A1L7VXV2_FUSPR|nr:uncharacterized protein FPRO_15562 [Fusarium proliferatum ET1]CZR45263.1 related to feruloyl esterase B precursor [Fusarium proliferatum ET1]
MVSSMIKKLLYLATVAISPVIAKPHSKCTAGSLLISHGTISSVQHHVAGDVIPLPNTVASCRGPNFKVNITADLCRIVVKVSSSDFSSVRIEAWLPDDWNTRLLATGTGGIGGCIDFPSVQNGAQLGFACFGTNTGHDGEQGFEFFLNQPGFINDFGHRGIYVEAVVAKQIVQQYYGLQNAQLYPDDFDGLLAGAPGIDWLHIVASKGILARRIGWPDLTSDAYVRPEQWKVIVAKKTERLDPLDGVEDGITDNPSAHAFDPMIMACGTGLLNSCLCLKPRQVESVRAAYEPLANLEGNAVYSGFALGVDTTM